MSKKRVVARDGNNELRHREFCNIVRKMLLDFNEGHDLVTPISSTPLTSPNKDLLDLLDRERTLKWHIDYGDESFYAERAYLWDTFYYYQEFSTANIFPFQKLIDHTVTPTPNSLFDFGGGLGMTTVHLQAMLPHAQLHYANVPGFQVDFARRLFERFAPNVNVIELDPTTFKPVHGGYPKCDAVACLDVLEHIKEPMPALRDIISDKTVTILDSSAWGRPAAGHWLTYVDVKNGVRNDLPAKSFKRRWKGDTIKERHEEVLHELGFHLWEDEVDVKYGWNKMPTIWRRNT